MAAVGSVRRDGWRWWVTVPCAVCGTPFSSYLALYRLCPRCRSARLAAQASARAARRAGATPGDCQPPGPPKIAQQPTTSARVVNVRVGACDVYIGRGSKWGNPFRICSNYNRRQVIAAYTLWLETQPRLLAALPELTGKTLGCYCAPLPCHGDVLLQLANGGRP